MSMNPLRVVLSNQPGIQNMVSVQSALFPPSNSTIADLRTHAAKSPPNSPPFPVPVSSPASSALSPLRKCRASLFVGFLTPVIIVAAVFFSMTYFTLNRSAQNSIEQISNHLFDVSVLHLAHSVNNFLANMPVLAAMVASHIDIVHNDTEAIKLFFAKTLLSAPVGPAPFALGFGRADGYVLIIRRETNNEMLIVERPPDNCDEILSIACSHIAAWKLDPNTMQRVGQPFFSYEYNTKTKPFYRLVSDNAKPTYWLPHIWVWTFCANCFPILLKSFVMMSVSPATFKQELSGDIAAGLIVPIFGQARSLQAIVFVDYWFSSLTSVFQTAQSTLGTTGAILLVNKDGLPLASSMEGHADGGLDVADLARLNNLPTTGSPASHPYELHLDKYGPSFVLQLNFRGDNQSVAGFDWRVFIVFPRSDFYSLLDSQNRVQVGLMVGCVAAFLAVLVTLFFVLLRRPLTRLSQSLMKLKQIIAYSHVESLRGFTGSHKLQFSAFSELARVQQDVLDVVKAAEVASQQRVQELRSAAETQRARERTENLMRSKEQFFQMMSYQLRSPIDAILGMAEVLSKTALSVQQRECTDSILFSASAMATVVNNILDFDQLEANCMVLEKKLFSVRKVVEKVAQVLQIHAEKKKLELIVHIDNRVPDHILGDESRLNQVLMNLLSHSINTTTDGHVLLKCFVENQRLRFDIDDTGIGMSAQTVLNIFEPFSQPRDPTFRESGLSLAISHRLVTLMQGTLLAFSEGEHQGSTFTFSITLDKTCVIPPELSSTNAGQSSIACDEAGKERQSSQPVSPLLSSSESDQLNQSEDHVAELSKTVLIVDRLPQRGRAVQELVRSLQLDHAYATSIDQLASLALGHPAVHAPVAVTHLQDYPAAKPSAVLTSFRATHVPYSLTRRVIFVVGLGFQPIPGSIPEVDGFCFVSKPITRLKLIDALQQLAPNLVETWKSPIEPFAEPSESDLTYDDDDLVSFCENRILIVDDQSMDQRATVLKLQQKGLKFIDTASNEAEALHLIQANSVPYDVIVIAFDDSRMGSELTQRILTMPKNEKVPIIGLVRLFLAPDAHQQCLDSGIKAVLAKPFDAHEFISLVQKYLLAGNVSITASWARPSSQAMNSSSSAPPSQLSSQASATCYDRKG